MNTRRFEDNPDREAYEEKPKWDEKGDNYITTQEVDFLSRTLKGLHIEWIDEKTKRRTNGWIARQCLHSSTDKKLDSLKYGDKFQMTCFEWAAKKIGLLK